MYQGIGQIPDTRNALLDWGNDGQFDTNDPGEGNGVLDEGERLDKNKLAYFSQQQIGVHGAFKAKILNKNFGIAVKFLNHHLGKYSAIGVGMDFGYISKIGNFEFASVVKNIPASGLIWSNGDKYFGPWINGKRNGNATMTWKDGRKYMGEFRNDQIEGMGTLFYPDGKKYEGEFPKKYFKEFLEYLDINDNEFWEIIDSWRLPHLWGKNNNEWILKSPVK